MTKAHPVEGDVKKAVNKLLDKYGWFHWMPAANQYGISGVSDILALKRGHFLAIEVKLKKATGSANQEAFMAKVREAGGHAMLINQDKLGELETFLQGYDSWLVEE